jgi:uncharacterized protein
VSYGLDVNILLYASDENSPRHAASRAFLQARTADAELLCLAWITLMSYLRIATHPSIFARPLSSAEALQNVEALLRLPRVRVLSETDGFLDTYRTVTEGAPVRGNLVPDAHLATLLLQHDIRTLYTTDADFRRFPFLDVRDPFA